MLGSDHFSSGVLTSSRVLTFAAIGAPPPSSATCAACAAGTLGTTGSTTTPGAAGTAPTCARAAWWTGAWALPTVPVVACQLSHQCQLCQLRQMCQASCAICANFRGRSAHHPKTSTSQYTTNCGEHSNHTTQMQLALFHVNALFRHTAVATCDTWNV